MLLRYGNGDRACVGAFRFDWAEEPVHVGGGKGPQGRVYIGFGKEEPRVVREVRGAGDSPLGDDGLEWLEVPLTGRLEWWFSMNRAEVYHFGDGEYGSG
jgi:hypothetical protein